MAPSYLEVGASGKPGAVQSLLYCATLIQTTNNGKPVGFGTGFFYHVTLPDGKFTRLLVTNKHVLEGADGFIVTLHLADSGNPRVPNGRHHTWTIGMVGRPIEHPDPDVDLCCISLPADFESSLNGNQRTFTVSLDRTSIPRAETWQGFDAIENVTMVGCPKGLFDNVNKLPLMRTGATASHIGKPYQGKDEFIIDIACFPGSSGSPVFIVDQGQAIWDRSSGTYNLGSIRKYFVGILYAGPVIDNEGQIVMSVHPKVSVNTMMHLGYVIRSNQMLAFDRLVHIEMGQPMPAELQVAG